MIKLLIIALIFVASAQTECNVCQRSNNAACHGRNKFSLCINGVPSKSITSCPKNYVCTAGRSVCYPQSEAEPSCDSMCNVCNDKKVYACKNETTIAFCNGNDRPDEGAKIAHCIENTVCDIYRSNGFCTEIGLAEPSCVTASGTNFPNNRIEPASPTEELTSEFRAIAEPIHSASETPTTLTEPTAATTTIDSTTTAATFDLDAVCKAAGKMGYYSYGDPTCKSYILCYDTGHLLAPVKYFCKKDQYFPPGATYCSSNKPDVCI